MESESKTQSKIQVVKEIPASERMHFLVDCMMALYSADVFDEEKCWREVIHFGKENKVDIYDRKVAFDYMQNQFKQMNNL